MIIFIFLELFQTKPDYELMISNNAFSPNEDTPWKQSNTDRRKGNY